MKGLRPSVTGQASSSYSLGFYLVTWMKGLRPHIRIAKSPFDKWVFTLWPEWRDYDPSTVYLIILRGARFYLVTWMKGLRRFPRLRGNKVDWSVFTLWPEWRDYDGPWPPQTSPSIQGFLPCDLNEGITTQSIFVVCYAIGWVFTLWPEWRDYDPYPSK